LDLVTIDSKETELPFLDMPAATICWAAVVMDGVVQQAAAFVPSLEFLFLSKPHRFVAALLFAAVAAADSILVFLVVDFPAADTPAVSREDSLGEASQACPPCPRFLHLHHFCPLT
jgi:hypothetical protein